MLPLRLQAGSQDQDRVGSGLQGEENPALGQEMGMSGPGGGGPSPWLLLRLWAASEVLYLAPGEALASIYLGPLGGTFSFFLPRKLRDARVSGGTCV